MTESLLTVRSGSVADTERVGETLGAVLRRGDVLVLEGVLGAGKTCLARGIVRGAGGDSAAVRSPTFVLHQPHQGRALTVHHVDLYRLGAGATVDVLDLEGALAEGAAVIEWGGYADLTPLHPFTVLISSVDRNPDLRLLRLVPPAPAHVEQAWRALCQAR